MDEIFYENISEVQLLPISKSITRSKKHRTDSKSYEILQKWAPLSKLKILQFFIDINIIVTKRMIMLKNINCDNIQEIIVFCIEKGITVYNPVNLYDVFQYHHTSKEILKYNIEDGQETIL